MSFEADTATAALRRDRGIELRGAYQRARDKSPRWAELDRLLNLEAARLARASDPAEITAIADAALAAIKAIADADLADRQREISAQWERNLSAQLFEARRLNRLAWAQRVGAPIVAAINRVIDRLREAESGITGRSETEADIRQHLTDIGDALSSLSATIAVEARASLDRQTAAEKAAAA